MDPNPRECRFCGNGLPFVPDEPVNMAFVSHLAQRADCRQAFDVWTDNMAQDFLGY